MNFADADGPNAATVARIRVSHAKARLKAMKFFRSPGCVGIRTIWEKGVAVVVVRFADPTFAEFCPTRVEGVEVRREVKAAGVYSL